MGTINNQVQAGISGAGWELGVMGGHHLHRRGPHERAFRRANRSAKSSWWCARVCGVSKTRTRMVSSWK